MIPHSRPRFGPEFEQALLRTLASGHIVMGKEAEQLEVEVAAVLRRPAAAAVDSGTAALELAIRALAGQQRIQRIGIPAYTCSSVLHAILNAGCTPVLMDCGDDLCLLPDAPARAQGMDAMVLVHPFGMMEPLVAAEWPCPVIEDIAQSAGAVLNGQPIGSFGDVAVASFHATKPWGGAYGGMVLGDTALIETVRMMRDPDHGGELSAYAGHHQLSDLHAAVARCRLAQAGEELERRRQVFGKLATLFADSDDRILCKNRGNDFRFIIRVEQAAAVIQHLRGREIMAARPVQISLDSLVAGDCPGAQRAWDSMVSIPLLADMSEDEFQRIGEAIGSCAL